MFGTMCSQLASAECLAYRNPCPLAASGVADPECLATRDACSRLPDRLGTSSGCVKEQRIPPTVGNVTCQDTSFVQAWCAAACPTMQHLVLHSHS